MNAKKRDIIKKALLISNFEEKLRRVFESDLSHMLVNGRTQPANFENRSELCTKFHNVGREKKKPPTHLSFVQ